MEEHQKYSQSKNSKLKPKSKVSKTNRQHHHINIKPQHKAHPGGVSKSHKKKSKTPKSFLKKVTTFLGSTIILFGKSTPVWAASLTGVGLLGLITFIITSGMAQDPSDLYRLNYARLLLEDETLLCSNDNYSTQYVAPHLYKVESALTQESIDKRKREIQKQINLIEDPNGNYSYYNPTQMLNHTSSLNYYNNELEKLNAMEPAIKDKISWIYPQQNLQSGKEKRRIYYKYFAPYFDEIDSPVANIFDTKTTDKPSNTTYLRQTLITLSDDSYQKLFAEIRKDPDNALKGISNLKCIEWLSFPDSIPEVNISPLKNFKNLRVLEAPNTKLKTTNIFNHSSILKNLSSLKILDIRGGLDYDCKTVAISQYNKDEWYLQNNSILSHWSCPPDKDNPDTYYNKRHHYSDPDKNYYDHCGSDLSSLEELPHLRMIYLPEDVHNFDTLLENKSIKFLSIAAKSPINFGSKIKITQKDEKSSKTDKTSAKSPEPDKGSSNKDKVGNDTKASVIEFLPQLEYLNVSGNILAAPFQHLKDLKELYLNTDEYGVDLTSIKSLKQLEIVDVSARADEEFCKTLDNFLPDTKISCKTRETKAAQIAEDATRPIYARNFNIKDYPYPNVVYEEHKIYPYQDESEETQFRGIDTIYKYSGESNNFNNQEEEYIRSIAFRWDTWGDWSYATGPYQMMQSYLRNNYNPDLELFRYPTGSVIDNIPQVYYEHMSQHSFDEKMSHYNLPEFDGSLSITVCNPKKVDKNMWEADYFYTQTAFSLLNPEHYLNKSWSMQDVFTGELEDNKTWSKVVFRDRSITKQRSLTKSQLETKSQLPVEEWEAFTDDAVGLFGNKFAVGEPGWEEGVFMGYFFRGWDTGPIGWPPLDLSGTGWPEPEPETEGTEESEEEDEELKKIIDYKPILKTPADGSEINFNSDVEFSWRPSTETSGKPVKYYWHVTIDGEEPSQLENWFGLDVGNTTTFTYTQDTLSEPLPGGIWVWNIGAEYSGGRIYWSEDRALFRTWVLTLP